MEIIIENIRSLSGRHNIPLKPLTFLTGENSSGKTTFLGVLSALFNRDNFPLWANFNRPPYELGNYDTIATYKGGSFGRAKHFSFGYKGVRLPNNELIEVEATFIGNRGHVQLQTFEAKTEKFFLSLKIDQLSPGNLQASYRLRNDDRETGGKFSLPTISAGGGSLPLVALLMAGQRHGTSDHADARREEVIVRAVHYLWNLAPGESVSIAPIRTRPERTYSHVAESFKPTGDHIPFVLEQIYREDPNSAQRKRVDASLRRFGEESGLFEYCGIKRLGRKDSDPFQVMVRIAGRPRNLIDVGYGVSQALPVIVQSILVDPDQLLLLQQPEVHLHPRAQAALGSFFARLVSGRKKPIIVETHSDYIIDRIRAEVAADALDHKEVGILYFHRHKLETIPSLIEMDKQGNLLNAPPYYREFFLEEELNLFTRTDPH